MCSANSFDAQDKSELSNRDIDQAPVSPLFTHTGIDNRPVIYAGRFADLVARVNLPGHYGICGEEDVPSRFSAAVDEATTLIVLDPRSFPFDAMTEDRWDVPLILVLPRGFDAASLTVMFGTTLFERLGFFDRIVTPDPDVWEGLRQRFCWAENQRIELTTDDPGEVAANLCALLEAESTPQAALCDDGYEVPRYQEGGDSRRDLRSVKAVHRVQAEALKPRFVVTRGERTDDVKIHVLEVGTGAGHWAGSFDPAKTRFFGVDRSEGMIEAARSNFPNQRFEQLGPNLLLPYDDGYFDLVFGVAVMQRNPPQVRRTLLSEMWRVARPAGRLLFLENFVTVSQREESTIPPMSASEFVDLILEETSGQVVLEHVEALRYPQDDLFRGGVLSLLRLGVARPR